MKYLYLSLLVLICFGLDSCHKAESFENDAYGNFDALWTVFDEHYCFFTEKGIDWEATGRKYRSKITPETTYRELFDILAEMIGELKDGHCNLSSAFDVSYYREWWTDYPQDFNLRTLEEYYLKFDWETTCGIMYRILDKNIGYMYYGSFAYTVGEGNLDYILHYFNDCDALIIDVRNNGGGQLTNVHTFAGRFIDKTFTGGYMIHKTGPGHNDFSEPYPVVYEPCEANHIRWTKPVVVLTNRSCFSAANDFICVMKQIPGVVIIGARTGGGGGIPFNSEIPCGWGIRFSASPLLDGNMMSIENGIDPTDGFEVHSPDSELAEGKDAILDFALQYLKNQQ